jgi:hypothetical protein
MILLITDQDQHWFFNLAKTIIKKEGSVLILNWEQFINSSWNINYVNSNFKILCNNNIFTKRHYCQAILSDSLDYCIAYKNKEDREYIMQSWFSLLEVINTSNISFINKFDLQAHRFNWREINRLIQNSNCKTIITEKNFYDTDISNKIQSAWSAYVKRLDHIPLINLFNLNEQLLIEVCYLPNKTYYTNTQGTLSNKILKACKVALKSIGSEYGRALLYEEKTDLMFIAISPNLFYNTKISNNLEQELNNSLAKYLVSLQQNKDCILDSKVGTSRRKLAITKSLRPNLLGNSVDC